VRLPIDTSAIAFLCALAPEPLVDFETRRPKADENGEPLYVIQLLAMGDGSADLLAVKVPGVSSQAIRQGVPVKVSGLVAQPWTMNDRSGVAFRAPHRCAELRFPRSTRTVRGEVRRSEVWVQGWDRSPPASASQASLVTPSTVRAASGSGRR
jgi:hypothetical protein